MLNYVIYMRCRRFLFMALLCGMSFLKAVAQETPSRYMMFDSRIIEQTDNVVLRVEQAVKHKDNPLQRWTHHVPWPMSGEYKFKHLIEGVKVPVWEEQTALHYPNVIWDADEHLFKMWYYTRMYDKNHMKHDGTGSKWLNYIEPRDKVHPVAAGSNLTVCYMISSDGLKWSRPVLDVFSYKGKPTNIVAIGNSGAGVFKDPHDSDPSRRYKMFANVGRTNPVRIGTAVSPDGIHWSDPKPAIQAKGDTHNNAFWAPDIKKYVGISRGYDYAAKVRTVVRAESKDFVNWSKPKEILRGPKDAQIYTLLPAYYAPGYYIGLMSIIKADGQVHTELAWSPDTRRWQRIDEGTPFIANSAAADGYDHGMIYASAPVVLDDGIRIYYAGLVEKHVRTWRTTSLNLATIGRDRFAGYACKDPQQVGTVTTKPFRLGDGGLKITADVQKGGEIRVAALDAGGDPIPEFTLADCDAVRESVTDRAVTWGGKDASHLPPSGAAFQFQLKRAKIFSMSGGMKPAP